MNSIQERVVNSIRVDQKNAFRYCPIVPMILVNGAEGIATGWSTRVLSHDIRKVIDNVRRLIDNAEMERLVGGTEPKTFFWWEACRVDCRYRRSQTFPGECRKSKRIATRSVENSYFLRRNAKTLTILGECGFRANCVRECISMFRM